MSGLQLRNVETFLQGSISSSFLRTADGMALDWINRNLYWTDVNIHAVLMTSLNHIQDEGFITTIYARNSSYKPRAIVLHPGKG